MFTGAISGIIKYFKKKNKIIAIKLKPEVDKIKNKKLDSSEEEKELSKLYNKYSYSVLPIFVLSFLFYVSLPIIVGFILSINSNNLTEYNGSLSLFSIDNIFNKGVNIYLAILVALIPSISSLAFKEKEHIDWVPFLISFLISIIFNIIFSKMLTGSFLLYLLGQNITSSIFAIKSNYDSKKYINELGNDSIDFKKELKDRPTVKDSLLSTKNMSDELVDTLLEKFDNKFKK